MEWFGSRELMPLVAWSRIVLPKLLGGLSIRNLLHHHIALLLKWIWRYFSGSQSLWRNLIQSKDNYSSSLVITELQIPSKGGPWRNICKVILPHSTPKNSVHCQVRKKISNGASTKFLHEIWVGPTPLKIQFPRMFFIASSPNASIACLDFGMVICGNGPSVGNVPLVLETHLNIQNFSFSLMRLSYPRLKRTI